LLFGFSTAWMLGCSVLIPMRAQDETNSGMLSILI
jgi:hypothetical protein